MKKVLLSLIMALVFTTVLGVPTASATLVTSSAGFTTPQTTTFFFPTEHVDASGPFVVGNGITVKGSPIVSVGGGPYSLADNGIWTSTFYWAATDSDTSGMIFNLGGLFGQVGGFINYVPGGGGFGVPIISAIAADGVTVLESYLLNVSGPISTPSATNGGAFRGISRSTADIHFFKLQGAFAIEHDITTGGGGSTAATEPASLTLLGTGLIGLIGLARRRLR